MSNATGIRMKKEEESNKRELNELEKWAAKHVTVVDELPFHIDENCPFLVKKLADAYKTFEEAPLPEYLVKWQKGED
jgi:hypothetical protein